MKAIGYIRLSVQGNGNGAGLEAQRATIEAVCARRGWTLAGIECDHGFGGATLKRPGIQSALAELDHGDADVLVAARLDRLSRSTMDFAGIMERARKRGWALVVCDVDMDTSTPAGEAMMSVMATFAQFERRIIGQRIKEALAIKKSEGVQLGRPSTLSETTLTRVTEAHRRGESLAGIARALNADKVATSHGGAKWHASTVRSIVKRASVADSL